MLEPGEVSANSLDKIMFQIGEFQSQIERVKMARVTDAAAAHIAALKDMVVKVMDNQVWDEEDCTPDRIAQCGTHVEKLQLHAACLPHDDSNRGRWLIFADLASAMYSAGERLNRVNRGRYFWVRV